MKINGKWPSVIISIIIFILIIYSYCFLNTIIVLGSLLIASGYASLWLNYYHKTDTALSLQAQGAARDLVRVGLILLVLGVLNLMGLLPWWK